MPEIKKTSEWTNGIPFDLEAVVFDKNGSREHFTSGYIDWATANLLYTLESQAPYGFDDLEVSSATVFTAKLIDGQDIIGCYDCIPGLDMERQLVVTTEVNLPKAEDMLLIEEWLYVGQKIS